MSNDELRDRLRNLGDTNLPWHMSTEQLERRLTRRFETLVIQATDKGLEDARKCTPEFLYQYVHEKQEFVDMTDANALMLFQSFQMVAGEFDRSGQTYTYKAHPSLKIEIDDLLVVPSKDHFGVLRVTACNDNLRFNCNKQEFKWVVCKLDMTAYNDLVSKEELAKTMLRTARQRREEEQRKEDLTKWLTPEELELLKSNFSAQALTQG